MTTLYSAWFQPDDVETRERMRVATGTYSGTIGMSKTESQGPINYVFEFVPNVETPTRQRLWTSEYRPEETAYEYIAELWLTTLQPGSTGVEGNYETALVSVGGASHLQDPWVGDLLTDIQNAVIAQVLAGTHPGVPAGLMSFSVEFETDDDIYPGTVADREVEVETELTFGEEYNRDGSFFRVASEFDGLAVIAIPSSASDPFFDEPDVGDYADPTPGYATTGDLGDPANAWFSTALEARALAQPPAEQDFDGGEVIGTADPTGGTFTFPIADSDWEAWKWEITRFGPDQNYGVPLMLTPEWRMGGSLPYSLERHTRGVASAHLYMNAVWTPPRYRIIYDVDYIPVTRQESRDDGRGLSSGPRLIPASKAGRLVGGYQ